MYIQHVGVLVLFVVLCLLSCEGFKSRPYPVPVPHPIDDLTYGHRVIDNHRTMLGKSSMTFNTHLIIVTTGILGFKITKEWLFVPVTSGKVYEIFVDGAFALWWLEKKFSSFCWFSTTGAWKWQAAEFLSGFHYLHHFIATLVWHPKDIVPPVFIYNYKNFVNCIKLDLKQNANICRQFIFKRLK